MKNNRKTRRFHEHSRDWDDHPTPEQFFGWLRKIQIVPERLLIAAILGKAVEDYQIYLSSKSYHGRCIFLDAENWIFNSKCNAFFGFDSICDILDLEPEYIRSGLLKWKARQLALPLKERRRRQIHRVASKGREMLIGKKGARA